MTRSPFYTRFLFWFAAFLVPEFMYYKIWNWSTYRGSDVAYAALTSLAVAGLVAAGCTLAIKSGLKIRRDFDTGGKREESESVR